MLILIANLSFRMQLVLLTFGGFQTLDYLEEGIFLIFWWGLYAFGPYHLDHIFRNNFNQVMKVSPGTKTKTKIIYVLSCIIDNAQIYLQDILLSDIYIYELDDDEQ